MLPQHTPRATRSRLVIMIGFLVIAGLACNVPIFSSAQESTPQIESTSSQPTSLPTPRVETDRSSETPADVAPSNEDAANADSGEPAPVPADSEPIPAAAAPAIPDCNAFDINAFNAIVEGTFSFVMQDQLNNCHFESDNNYRLLVGGGLPISSEEMQGQFNSTFGAVPGSSYEAVDDFYLGMSFSSASVSAQGVSNSGHSIVIVGAAQPGADPDELKQIFTELARESAGQLNQQW